MKIYGVSLETGTQEKNYKFCGVFTRRCREWLLSAGVGINSSRNLHSFLTIPLEISVEVNQNTPSSKIETCLTTFPGALNGCPDVGRVSVMLKSSYLMHFALLV